MNKLREQKVAEIIQKNLLFYKTIFNLTNTDIAKVLSVSNQQVRKYVIGIDRIPIVKLYIFCKEYKLNINDFFNLEVQERIFTKNNINTNDYRILIQRFNKIDNQLKPIVIKLLKDFANNK